MMKTLSLSTGVNSKGTEISGGSKLSQFLEHTLSGAPGTVFQDLYFMVFLLPGFLECSLERGVVFLLDFADQPKPATAQPCPHGIASL